MKSGWTTKISGAIVEQGIFAGSNFVLNIILARELGSEGYGIFVVAYTWFLLIQNQYDAFINEPMAILGSSKYGTNFRKYIGYLFVSHLWVGAIGALLMGIGALITFFFDQALTNIMIAAALVTPFLLSRWLCRQPFFVLAKPFQAAIGGAIYFAISLAGLLQASSMGILTPLLSLIIMAVGSLAAALAMTFIVLKPDWDFAGKLPTQQILREHWDYGKWSSFSKLTNWIPSNVFYVLLPQIASLSDTGAYRASGNLVLPMSMAITAMMAILLPNFSRIFTSQSLDALDRRVQVVNRLFLIVTLGFLVIIGTIGVPLMSLIYDGQFDSYVDSTFLWVLALTPVLQAPAVVFDAALRVTGGVKETFLSSVLPSLLTPVLGLFLYQAMGLVGLALTTNIIQILLIIFLFYFYRRSLTKLPSKPPTPNHLAHFDDL
jgi:O-antigen/teichoic acid export membrane protein